MLLIFALLVTTLPSAVSNGRFFYTPDVRGAHVRIWLDTDGDGFITANAATRLHLDIAGQRARFPSGPGLVTPLASAGFLPLFDPDSSDRIFDGIDAQFGETWFAGRITQLDYRHKTLSLLDTIPASAGRLGRAEITAPHSVVVVLNGEKIPMALDTAATVVLDAAAAARMHDSWGSVRATSFLRSDVMTKWHSAHPQWPYVNGGAGLALLLVPRLAVGSFFAKNVWFSTRPKDDVFEGETVVGKIGPTAFRDAVVTLDYPGSTVYFD